LGAALAVAAASTVLLPAQAAAQTAGQQVTFSKHIAPILYRSCVNCHRPGSLGPMSLINYEDVRPWARSVVKKVVAREMPPWHIARNVGIQKFKDDPSLTDEEIALISRWAETGAARGNPSDMPALPKFDDSEAWHIRPDLVVKSVEHTIPKTGPDWWGNYVVDTGLTEDRYLKAVETKPGPGAKQVVHHAVTFLIQDEGETELIGRDSRGAASGGELGGFLNEYAVGKNGDIFPEGTGRIVKAGSKIRFNMHYHPVGEEKKDQTQVALEFYPKGYKPKYYILASHTGDNDDLDIPAGKDMVMSEGFSRLNRNARIVSFQPHLHNRGTAQCMEAIMPDGTRQMLSCVDRYQFGWHIVYNYADDTAPLLPAGTTLRVISWHDNSAANKYNPDPKNWAGFGQRSIDDMAFAWVSYIWLDDEDFKKQVDERKKGGAVSTQQQP
jgi:hypothetical protein